MGLLSKNCPVTVFKIHDPSAVTVDKLKQFAFQPIDELKTETKGVGWTSFDDMLDTTWAASVPQYGEWFCFALRVDARKIPAAVMKKALAEAYKAELEQLQAEGKSYIPRGRKKELKDLVTQKLLTQIQPSPTVVDLALDISTGLLYAGTVSNALIETLAEHMKTSFGIEPEELNLAGLESRSADLQEAYAVESFLSGIYGHSADVQLDGHSFTVAEAGEVTLGQADDRSVTTKNEQESVMAGLQAGLYFQKLKMTMTRGDTGDEWVVTMDRGFRFPALKCPTASGTENAKDNEKDREAVVLERLYLVSQAVAVLHTLFRQQWA